MRGGGVKPSSNTTFPDLIKRFFERFKVLSSRINEVHCGILEKIKRYRNTSHKTIINCFARQSGMTHFVKCVAFTLAETLVVMGIIGVVAALTIPNLNQSTGDREKVAKLKKIHSNLEDAFGRAQAIYGPADEWESQFKQRGGIGFYSTEGAKFIAERLIDFMKISKNCGEDSTPCFKDKPLDLGGGSAGISNLGNYFILADGTSIGIAYEGAGIHRLYIDIDGPNKGSNTFGKDLFQYFSYDTVRESGNLFVPSGSDTNDISQCLKGNSCYTWWVLQTGNMDYLKANKGVCPNGTTLSWENTSCK